jgi:hypothetical protein
VFAVAWVETAMAFEDGQYEHAPALDAVDDTVTPQQDLAYVRIAQLWHPSSRVRMLAHAFRSVDEAIYPMQRSAWIVACDEVGNVFEIEERLRRQLNA